MQTVLDSSTYLDLLSELTLKPSDEQNVAGSIRILEVSDLANLEKLAASNHVVIRAFKPLQKALREEGLHETASWITAAIDREQSRIDYAIAFLQLICNELKESGCPAIVIKSLDHWPDLGSDLDLYSDADSARIIEVMKSAFKAEVADRSWGDRLANKWNFIVPGLPELVEVHIGRLGQTGEQTGATHSLAGRACERSVGQYAFSAAAPEDRIVISTLQRMYRHFYIRLCDIVDNARLLDAQAVDFDYLHSLGMESGLWQGIATYLVIVSEYVERYRGYGVPLPTLVTQAAKFGTDQVRFRRDFLRVSILPHSIKLYANELKTFLLKGDLRNGFRLSLLPCLATAAALEQKLTGSDKGIW